MIFARALVTAVTLAFAIAAATAAMDDSQQPAAATTAAIDVTRLGAQVGDKVPDFTLPDQNGRQHSLASLMGPKGVVLVFYRSSDW